MRMSPAQLYRASLKVVENASNHHERPKKALKAIFKLKLQFLGYF